MRKDFAGLSFGLGLVAFGIACGGPTPVSGDGYIPTPEEQRAALIGAWRQIDAASGATKTNLLFNADGTFSFVGTENNSLRISGTFRVDGTTLTVSIAGSNGERVVLTAPFLATPTEFVNGFDEDSWFLMRVDQNVGAVGNWSSSKSSTEIDAMGREGTKKTERFDVAVRSDNSWNAVYSKSTLRAGVSTPVRSESNGRWSAPTPLSVSISRNNSTAAPVTLRFFGGRVLASDKAIFIR